MSIRNILLFAIILTLFSCKHNDYKQKILGDWKLVGMVDVEKGKPSFHSLFPGDCLRSGYTFFNNDSCDSKIGFVLPYRNKKSIFNPMTVYKLDGDSLMIYNNVDSAWNGFKIKSINGDTLLVRLPENGLHHELYYQYIKQHYVANKAIDFDQIILTGYGTWGLNNDMSIDKSGKVIYREYWPANDILRSKQRNSKLGKYLGEQDGYALYYHPQPKHFVYYTAKTSLNKFNELLKGFQLTDFDHLKSEYRGNASDGPEVNLTFVKNGKVIKTIRADEGTGPFELIWAYMPLQYLPQKLKLDSVNSQLNPSPDARFFGFEDSHQYASIPPSMFFYLSTLLRKAKQTTIPLHKHYNVPFDESADVAKMETDGRLYQIAWKNGGKKTYDIGFNFLTANSDVIKFENRKEGN